jgi:hypothetical protein
VLALLAAGAIARADDGTPGAPPVPRDVGQATGLGTAADTSLTPVPAFNEDVWKQVAGARYPNESTVKDSVTPFTADLYTVSFRDDHNGLAGGSDEVDCGGVKKRVPVIYRFRTLASGDGVWEESYRGSCDAPGYVGAIAWRGESGEAIAVGGDGSYVRREDSSKPRDAPGYVDPAGHARVWSFDGNAWEEQGGLPAGMRGMQALAIDPDNPDFGFAGGLGQMWQYSKGEFKRGWDASSDPSAMAGAADFVYRVRRIVFVPGGTQRAFAVTAGCCNSNPALNTPRILAWEEKQWWVNGFPSIVGDGSGGVGTGAVNARPDMPDSLYDLLAVRGTASPAGTGTIVSFLATPGGTPGSADPSPRLTQPFCSGPPGVTVTGTPWNYGSNPISNAINFALTSGPGWDPVSEAARTQMTSAWLLAAGGDVDRSPDLNIGGWGLRLLQPDQNTGRPERLRNDAACQGSGGYSGDEIPDWAVGELSSSAAVHGAEAVAYFSGSGALYGDTVNPVSPDPGSVTGYQPPRQAAIDAYIHSHWFLLSSYSLNAVSFAPGSSTGWAVGDHGAIMVHSGAGGSGAAGSEPAPPKVDATHASAAPDTGAFDAFRPLRGPAPPGVVPPLSTRPVDRLAAPRLLGAGSPDPVVRDQGAVEDVRQMVMSRDGQEGWAIGPSEDASRANGITAAPSLFHFTGGRWVQCDQVGLGAQLPADPACSAVAPLRNVVDSSGSHVSVKLVAAARVPLESDGDPSNDDEFEVVAVGTPYPDGSRGSALAPMLLRYSHGRWGSFGDRSAIGNDLPGSVATTVMSVAFVAPDDGWLLMRLATTPAYRLYHYDGKTWTRCASDPASCGASPDSARQLLSFGGSDGGGTAVPGVVPRGLAVVGRRVFLYGARAAGATVEVPNPGGSSSRQDVPNTRFFPFVAVHDAGGGWTTSSSEAGLDPGAGPSPDPKDEGRVSALSVVQTSTGLAGWATGKFGGTAVTTSGDAEQYRVGHPPAVLMRLGDGGWRPFAAPGSPPADYLMKSSPLQTTGEPTPAMEFDAVTANLMASVPGGAGLGAVIAQPGTGRLMSFDAGRGSWGVIRAERPGAALLGNDAGPVGGVQAVAPDGHGGAWVAVRNSLQNYWSNTGGGQVYFFHYAPERSRPVFEERPGPGGLHGSEYTAMAGNASGTLWLTTRSDTVYRYDRLMGWDRVRISGWDPGRVVTRASEANAVALNDAGEGVVVGKGGRIADLAGSKVRLDAASGTSCANGGGAPGACGTSRDLRAAAVAPDGSALSGGEKLALLWRPAGGGFRAIAKPDTSTHAEISGISMPAPDRAWLTVDTGEVFAGTLAGGEWSWRRENEDASQAVLNRGRDHTRLGLRAVAVDAAGHGFAVGDAGLLLERNAAGGEHPWHRLSTGFLDNFTSVTLAPNGGPGALVGGHNGVLLTWVDGRFELARPADFFQPPGTYSAELTGPVAGLALVPGPHEGDVEAWAALAGTAPGPLDRYSDSRGEWLNNGYSALLHYSSNPSDPLLDPAARAHAEPDAPPARPGEVSFAAFGNTGCPPVPGRTCWDPGGTTADHEVITHAVTDAIAQSSHQPGGPRFALFTGDTVGDTSTPAGNRAAKQVPPGDNNLHGPVKLRRWRELVAQPLWDAGVPMFAALGRRDLSSTNACYPYPLNSPTVACWAGATGPRVGESEMWRQAFAGMPAPWGTGSKDASAGGMQIHPVADGEPGAGIAPEVHPGEARTHYAFDVLNGGRTAARVAVLDTSLRNLGGEAGENPVEVQLNWLKDVLESRPDGARAVVLSTTPPYTYGAGAQDTQLDGTALEALLLREHASVLVTGRVGWNALYYTAVAGVHTPCPGGSYPSAPPDGPAPTCVPAQGADAATKAAQDAAGNALQAGAAGDPGAITAGQGATGTLSTVIAASAGVGFGPDANDTGKATDGYWHGYSNVRLDPDGNVIVEQRPVLDWITIEGQEHTLQPGHQTSLHGYGREPVGIRTRFQADKFQLPADQEVRYDEIDSPAITHVYSLVEADPQRPYVPRADANGAYAPLDPSIAVIDRQTGTVTAGRGNHPRIYAVALLSVGDKVATYPLAFEPRRSFRPAPPPAQLVVRAQHLVPAIHVLAAGAAAAPASPPPPPPPPPPGNVNPNTPAVPGMPPPSAPAAAPPPAPPAPPPPPPPPGFSQGLPLSLSAPLAPISIQASVIPPTPPPINPAPPSGGAARKEAKQRQAATAKSEETGQEKTASESQGVPGDSTANAPYSGGHAMSRRADAGASQHPFTRLVHADQPSAWARGALYGGAMTLAALLLALGFTAARPRSRRRPPELPAPAWARSRRRR